MRYENQRHSPTDIKYNTEMANLRRDAAVGYTVAFVVWIVASIGYVAFLYWIVTL